MVGVTGTLLTAFAPAHLAVRAPWIIRTGSSDSIADSVAAASWVLICEGANGYKYHLEQSARDKTSPRKWQARV